MDWERILANLPIIILAVVLLVVQIFRRRRPKPEGTPREVGLSLLAEVSYNLRLVESYHLNRRGKKFRTSSWERNKTKLDFLERSLQSSLSSAFTMAEEFNQQIETAKRQKSTIYMASIDVDRLREPLTKSEKGLEEWLESNFGSKQPPLEYPSITDYIFGSRSRRY